MLYNPELYKEPSVRDMADFCATKDPTEVYDWTNSGKCACAQYSHTKGMVGANWITSGNPNHGTWSHLNQIARGTGEHSEWTFGQVTERLRKELEPVA